MKLNRKVLAGGVVVLAVVVVVALYVTTRQGETTLAARVGALGASSPQQSPIIGTRDDGTPIRGASTRATAPAPDPIRKQPAAKKL